MPTNNNVDNLKINVLTIDQYNNTESTNNNELYVVNETLDLDDPGNIISSKTYADKGREAIATQTTEPTSQYTQIWINPDEEVVYITPASSDMDNITSTGSENVLKSLTPDFLRGVSYSQSTNSSFTVTETGWLYILCGINSSLELKNTNSSGATIAFCTTDANNRTCNHILLESGTTVYVNTREGSVTLTYYPCKGLA